MADLCSAWLEKKLDPANEAYQDEVRQQLDAEVLCGILGLPDTILKPLTHFRRQWCSEPSVHGGKATQPV